LLTHSRKNNDVGVLLFGSKELVNLLANFSLRDLAILSLVLPTSLQSHNSPQTILTLRF